eukprot:248517_1
MSTEIKYYKILWRNTQYDLPYNTETTINDFKQQLQFYTDVPKCNIKLVGMRVIKKYKKLIKRINDETLIIYLESTSKKLQCFKMIGTPKNQIFTDFYLKFRTMFRLVIQSFLRKYKSQMMANDIFTVIFNFIFNKQCSFDLNPNFVKKHSNSIKIDNENLHATCSPVAAVSTQPILSPVTAPILCSNMQNVSFYQCRLKILLLEKRSQISFVNFSRRNGKVLWKI